MDFWFGAVLTFTVIVIILVILFVWLFFGGFATLARIGLLLGLEEEHGILIADQAGGIVGSRIRKKGFKLNSENNIVKGHDSTIRVLGWQIMPGAPFYSIVGENASGEEFRAFHLGQRNITLHLGELEDKNGNRMNVELVIYYYPYNLIKMKYGINDTLIKYLTPKIKTALEGFFPQKEFKDYVKGGANLGNDIMVFLSLDDNNIIQYCKDIYGVDIVKIDANSKGVVNPELAKAMEAKKIAEEELAGLKTYADAFSGRGGDKLLAVKKLQVIEKTGTPQGAFDFIVGPFREEKESKKRGGSKKKPKPKNGSKSKSKSKSKP